MIRCERLFWLACTLLGTARAAHTIFRQAAVCGAYEALEATIYEQLTPFLGGISQNQVDKAISWFSDPGRAPKHAELKYNMTAARTLQADDPEYPYSNPYIVKVVVKDGEFYLPGGRIAPIREGFSFTSQWYGLTHYEALLRTQRGALLSMSNKNQATQTLVQQVKRLPAA